MFYLVNNTHVVIKFWVLVYFTVKSFLKLTHPSLQTDQGAQQVFGRGLRRRFAAGVASLRLQGREDLLHPGRVQRHGLRLPGADEHPAGQR